MTRSTPPLQPHLLTRSDLARMAVPAGEVMSWLGNGDLEQVGSLPGDIAADPVFTVLTPERRLDLMARLAAIGKQAVVLTPQHMRSFLMRAMLLASPDGGNADAHADADLAQLLRAAATEVAVELDAVLQLAAEEAHLEALELAAAAGEGEAPAFVETSGDGAAFADELACFDLADLEAAVGGDRAAAPTPAAAARSAPIDEPRATSAEPAPPEPPAAPADPEPGVPAGNAATPGDGEREPPSIERVEAFLAELKDSVLELAQRRGPPPVDMRPFVTAMQASLDRSVEQAAATASALQGLGERVDELGERVDKVAVPPTAGAAAATIPVPAKTLPLALAGLAVLAVAWSILFWLALDAPRLAAGTLIGANFAGCLLLSSWWRRA